MKNVYSYFKDLPDVRPGKTMTDEQLEQFAPWNPDVKKHWSNLIQFSFGAVAFRYSFFPQNLNDGVFYSRTLNAILLGAYESANALQTDPNYLIMGEEAPKSDNGFMDEVAELLSRITDPKVQEMPLKQIRVLV